MRVLLAMDGSDPSETARNLVASIRWPEASIIRIVAVVEPMSAALIGLSPYTASEFNDREITASLESRLTDAAACQTQSDLTVETLVLHGRPASQIVEQATEFRANLVVVGSRGLGRLRSMLLGSVSAEVVDHAPCPVLVARAATIGHVLVAVDGSDSAQRAVEHLADAKYLAGHRLHVLSVQPAVDADRAYRTVDPTDPAAQRMENLVAESRRLSVGHAAEAAEELERDGYDVHWTIRSGNPVIEIIEAAGNLGCDLIVMGSRGRTGLDRLLLGSVARNVLLHSPASVLIVREPVRERDKERERERPGTPVLSPAG